MAVMGILDNFQAPGDGWLGTDAGVFLIAPLDVRKMNTLGVLPYQAPDPECGWVNAHPAGIITLRAGVCLTYCDKFPRVCNK